MVERDEFELIDTVTPVPVLAGLHRAHVYDRFFAVPAGSGAGRTRNWKSSPFAIRYCCLRFGKRPQQQIHARKPAQGAWRNAILRFVLIFDIRAAILLTSNSESLTATQDSQMEILSKIEHCKEALETRH